jgi:hypothetical protein
VAVPIDDVGCFTFGQRPDGPFRLRCHNDAQADVRTGWVTLLAPGGTTLPGPPKLWGSPSPIAPLAGAEARGGACGAEDVSGGCRSWSAVMPVDARGSPCRAARATRAAWFLQ